MTIIVCAKTGNNMRLFSDPHHKQLAEETTDWAETNHRA